jgi:hypothetical protein
MFQDKLFNQKEGFFMINMLPNLDNCPPSMWSKLFFTIITLSVDLYEFGDESLLHSCFVIKFFLDG